MSLTADDILEGLTEAEVQHVREKAENLLAEILECQGALSRLSGPGTSQRRAAIAHRLAQRTEEYRPLKAALKNWNIRRSNQHQRDTFRDIRDASLRAMNDLRRRCDEAPIGWTMFADEQLIRSLNDLLDAGKFYVGQDATDDERFTLSVPSRQPGSSTGDANG